jgi:cold shock CspA family protein
MTDPAAPETNPNPNSNTSAKPDTGYSGRVKWFNNKYGYGFVTVIKTDAEALVPVGTDVFAHHSEVNVSNDQYRYLVQGEYVAFDIVKTTTGNHEYQCSKVKGMYGGQLICETRHEARAQYKTGHGSGGDLEASCYGDVVGNTDTSESSDGRRRFAGVKPSHGDVPRGGGIGRGMSSIGRGGLLGGRGGFRR